MAALTRPFSVVESFVEELLAASVSPAPDADPNDCTHRFYACVQKKENPGVQECSKGGEKEMREAAVAAAVAGYNGGQAVAIGRQWPEILDQIVLSQKLGKKVSIANFSSATLFREEGGCSVSRRVE